MNKKVRQQLDKAILEAGFLAASLERTRRILNRILHPELRRRRWTQEEIRQLRKRFANSPTKLLAEELGRPIYSVHNMAHKLGIRKSAEYFASGEPYKGFGKHPKMVASQFKKGIIPWNKGKKIGPARGRAARTTFKKGHRPRNWKPIGSTRMGDGYLYEKTSDNRKPYRRNWEMVHVLLWEKEKGPIPRGFNVQFKNKNRLDIRIDNLELISKKQNMLRNTIHNYPKPIKDIMHMAGVLKRAINKRKKSEND